MENEKSEIPRKAIPLFWLPLAGQIICVIFPFLLIACNKSEEDYIGPFFSLFLFATLFGIGNIICAVNMGLKGKSVILRPFAVWSKVVFSVLSAVGAVSFLISVFITGMMLTLFAGLFGLFGTLTVAFFGLSWLYCMGLSVSAYTIAFVWVEVKEKRMKPAKAVMHTILQFFIVIDLIDALVVFFTTHSVKKAVTNED